MPRIPFPSTDINYLVYRRFPTLKARRAAASNHRRSFPDQERARLLNEEAERYREELLQKSPSEIAALVAEQKADERQKARRRAELDERTRFFHRREAAADFNFWSRAAYWTLDEAVALSLGKQPQTVNWKTIQPYLKVSPFAVEFEQRRMLATRAKDTNQLADSNLPGFFLAWANRNRMDVPTELVKAVEAHGHQVADWKTAYDEAQATNSTLRAELDALRRALTEGQRAPPAVHNEKPLITRERETALKLVIGMAIGGYGYEPTATRSSVAREISEDIVRAGLTLDEDTVRSWLKEARDNLLPDKPEDGDD